jgi:hypothetical protein
MFPVTHVMSTAYSYTKPPCPSQRHAVHVLTRGAFYTSSDQNRCANISGLSGALSVDGSTTA